LSNIDGIESQCYEQFCEKFFAALKNIRNF